MRKLLYLKLREIKGVHSRLPAFGILLSPLQITQAGVSMEASMETIAAVNRHKNKAISSGYLIQGNFDGSFKIYEVHAADSKRRMISIQKKS